MRYLFYIFIFIVLISCANQQESVSHRNQEVEAAGFEKKNNSISKIYREQLRKTPDLSGKIVLEITINKNGNVTNIDVIETDIHDKVLLSSLVNKVYKINFGKLEDSTEVTIKLPIEFIPR